MISSLLAAIQGLPDDWLEELLESGVTKEEVMANPEAIIGMWSRLLGLQLS
jgi:hypothetical protein